MERPLPEYLNKIHRFFETENQPIGKKTNLGSQVY